jgi:hypothetical protein
MSQLITKAMLSIIIIENIKSFALIKVDVLYLTNSIPNTTFAILT